MRLLRHLAGYLPANLAGAIAAFGGVYVFTRLLSPDQYGQYALMVSALAIIHTISLTWAEAATYRFATDAHSGGYLPDHYRTGLGLLTRSLFLGFLLIAGLGYALRGLPDYVAILPWLAVLLPLSAIVQMALEAHRARLRVGRYVIVQSLRVLGGFGLGAYFAWRGGFGAAAPFMGLVVATGLAALSEGSWLLGKSQNGRTSPQARRTWFYYGAPIAAALVLDILLSAADRFLLAWFIDEATVGAYAAGYGVADKTVLLICASAAMAGSPLVMNAYDKAGPEAARSEARGLIATLLLVGLPAATGLALTARPLAEALIGEDLRQQAMQIIPWIAFAGLLNGLMIHYFSEAFQLTRRTGERALLMLLPAGLNIILNLVLIPQYALMGAVYATVASYGVGVALLALAGRRHLALPLGLGELARTIVASAAMWPVLHWLPALGGWPELFMKAVAGALTYVIVAFALDAGGARHFVREKWAASKAAGGA